ncbi:MAG: hypothetical protein JSS12_09015, partial [Verrucomicrobia bacterium]|nr:hypothetical protein [Verrucomicrobiota bacterium]
LQKELDIRKAWSSGRVKNAFLSIISLGIASCFLRNPVTKEELEARITLYRESSLEFQRSATIIQRLAAKKLYKTEREVKKAVQNIQKPQFNSLIKTAFSLAAVWATEGPSLRGYRGQIIWSDIKALFAELKQRGFYVFLHAHSYPITLHHELASHFLSMHQSAEFKAEKPDETRRKFRAPGVAQYFKNTSEYLKSPLARSINSGASMDDHHRETIISCDAIPANSQPYESANHFFHSNRSIVDTASSTHISNSSFDLSFISRFIQNPSLRSYAVSLFTKARKELSTIADYGMVRVIAIAKETLVNPETNYIWRSHAFGRLCTCKHTPKKYGHDEFVETLESHQKGKYNYCKERTVPQYRILAANLDKDPKKMVFNMDCLNSEERSRYEAILEELKTSLEHLIRLEQLGQCKSKEALQEVIDMINPLITSSHYIQGTQEALRAHKGLIDGS